MPVTPDGAAPIAPAPLGAISSPVPPQPHFPSYYLRPTVAPNVARKVKTTDGAQIAAFVYGGRKGYGEGYGEARHPGTDPVLFLHGNGEEHGIFGVQINGLVGDGRCAIGVDSRARGSSTRGRAPLTYELMAADALTVLDALGVQRVHVVGFSDGAIEALLIARDHPERVASVLSMGANLTPEGVLAEDDWDMEGTAVQCEAWATWLESGPEGVNPSIVTPSAEEARTTAELMRLMMDEPHIPAASLGAIRCPVTVMAGEFDCIDPAETQRIVDAIPGARKVVVPGADHVLPKCAPDDVNRELFSLLRRVEASPR